VALLRRYLVKSDVKVLLPWVMLTLNVLFSPDVSAIGVVVPSLLSVTKSLWPIV
jgi:hypothetical protein